jgi:glycosyltransferase involved in cell wall biosynthesis
VCSSDLVFVCEFERKAYESKVGRIRIRNEVVYNGLDDGDFELVGELPNAVHFLYVGMLRDLKGPDIFIEAFAKTERRLRRPLSAMMIGDGPQRDEYLQMMTRLGLGRRITMLPAMDIKEAFATSQTVVVPSRAEALPYIVLEAIAAGKTVIASDVGGISEILGKDSAALVPAGNSDAMADAMVASLTDADWKRRNMPDRTSFQSRFSARRMADGITGLYRELLAR